MRKEGSVYIAETIEDISITRWQEIVVCEIEEQPYEKIFNYLIWTDNEDTSLLNSRNYHFNKDYKVESVKLKAEYTHKFIQDGMKALRHLFPEDFTMYEIAQNDYKRFIKLQLDLMILETMFDPEIRENFVKMLNDQADNIQPKGVIIKDIYEGFNKMVFNLSMVDQVHTVHDLKSMNVLEFYVHKQNVTAYVEEQKRQLDKHK